MEDWPNIPCCMISIHNIFTGHLNLNVSRNENKIYFVPELLLSTLCIQTLSFSSFRWLIKARFHCKCIKNIFKHAKNSLMFKTNTHTFIHWNKPFTSEYMTTHFLKLVGQENMTIGLSTNPLAMDSLWLLYFFPRAINPPFYMITIKPVCCSYQGY